LGETLFISDLHLTPERPGAVALFLRFLRERAPAAERLYILGDLFDVWIGDDDDTHPYPEILGALRTLCNGGTALYFMRGNRDFLVGRAFARATGCLLLKEPTRIELQGTPTLLMHGDLLCTDDRAYQRFRRKARNPLVMRLFLWKGLEKRRAMAMAYRRQSGAAKALKAESIMDTNQTAVERYLRKWGATQLIHGHTHRPADHHFELDGRPARRLVLAEWEEDRGEALAFENGVWRREPIE
jgi:UDP-2,3-diacylglucosamine hydrolase